MRFINAILCPCLYFLVSNSFAQSASKAYTELIKQADSFYNLQEYRNSGACFSKAFEIEGLAIYSTHRYNAACSWALAGEQDSAFEQIELLAGHLDYKNWGQLATDQDLVSLHTDTRWELYLTWVKNNKEKSEQFANKVLVSILDSVYFDDQFYRKKWISIEKKLGVNSEAYKSIQKVVHLKDSVNLVKVTSILDTYGWLGADSVGSQGNSTLFLVIQHSNQATQEKYLPMMREAVKNGRANARSLALLEDRIALGQGKCQIYGSQIGMNPETGLYVLLPLCNPDEVDKRRAEVGLAPIANYISRWNLVWDLNQYKLDLSHLKELFRISE